ncbi:hypothetical protein BB561_005780 [Smittium simulii]|uniref:Methyltransferase domain-containing protein n=1 Tax=Smittium simulii TaxID=133385 RepID=A0A2T9Y899_9FUNG|nr:hypothetical protein BB561_005780 [Smittium simulii]
MSTNEGRNLAPSDWQRFWDTGDTLWDVGKPNIALMQLLEERAYKLPEGTGLVAGCGAGYDVIYLAQRGHATAGLDVSETAIQKAKQLASNSGLSPSAIAENISWIVGDFYSFKLPEALFQFAYDFTFFCTVFPTDRPRWAKRYSEIISSGGQLITLMYPMEEHGKNPPPFILSEEIYHQALDPYFELTYIDRDPAKEPPRTSKMVMAVWTRK